MATIETFQRTELKKTNPLFTMLRTTVETAFYGSNMHEIANLSEAYELARTSPGVIVTDMPVQETAQLGLPEDAKVLVENGGKIVGRTAKARRYAGEDKEEDDKIMGLVRDVIFQNRVKKYHKATAYVGLDEAFMVKAHIAFPKGYENNLYSWLLNFQWANDSYNDRYTKSKPYSEGDIYVYADPDWRHPDYPMGLAYFEPDRNVACILGMQYFGEFKKGTLSLAWGTAHRNGYVSCHGGLKEFHLEDRKRVFAFFGLSGSGKSTLTHSKHHNKYKVKVLHDDDFIIDLADGSSIALEPSYFDKTQDYPADHPEQAYFMTVQNVGVTKDVDNKLVLVTEDIRNGNGRTVKSRYATPNRVDKLDSPIEAVYWIMKDDSLPPLIKIDNAILGATFGATLATKRSSAETARQGEKRDQLVIEPYANPFRVYPLLEDFNDFKKLLDREGIDCYIINTGAFLDKDITKDVTLSAIESIVDNTATFKAFGTGTGLTYLEVPGYEPPMDSAAYKYLVKVRMQMRKDYLVNFNKENLEFPLPDEAIEAVDQILNAIQ
ncbi:phosphoenolpyruvate carboxykinase (ATP) [Aerococcus sp. 1KP-2016]|uniref:phosphoenolpyruvate carboxykinase (ATP) n=1 Tax=Aerococcus sp. 1KP-2016 TaxID=1981982 RepID=UPI000B9857AA|nr:phosphoenolpyruvate carboxykinase (ATP) [Aerococcus sp. 1KP-2016]OYQ65236.1 phosphoenolpyruvate carboxykinase [Aerococcus sp. 1KP-2016]